MLIGHKEADPIAELIGSQHHIHKEVLKLPKSCCHIEYKQRHFEFTKGHPLGLATPRPMMKVILVIVHHLLLGVDRENAHFWSLLKLSLN